MGLYPKTDSIEFQRETLDWATSERGKERMKQLGLDHKAVASGARKKIRQLKKSK